MALESLLSNGPDAGASAGASGADAAAAAGAQNGGAGANSNDGAQSAPTSGQSSTASSGTDAGGNTGTKDGAGAPVQYTDFKAPEGFKFDAETVTELQALAKDLNLTQEQAQKLADREAKAQTGAAKSHDEQIVKTQTAWQTELKADKEFGGEHLPTTLQHARKSVEAFFPELKDQVGKNLLFDHPAVLKGLARIGKAISEDTSVSGGGNKPPAKMYPNSNHVQ